MRPVICCHSLPCCLPSSLHSLPASLTPSPPALCALSLGCSGVAGSKSGAQGSSSQDAQGGRKRKRDGGGSSTESGGSRQASQVLQFSQYASVNDAGKRTKLSCWVDAPLVLDEYMLLATKAAGVAHLPLPRAVKGGLTPHDLATPLGRFRDIRTAMRQGKVLDGFSSAAEQMQALNKARDDVRLQLLRMSISGSDVLRLERGDIDPTTRTVVHEVDGRMVSMERRHRIEHGMVSQGTLIEAFRNLLFGATKSLGQEACPLLAVTTASHCPHCHADAKEVDPTGANRTSSRMSYVPPVSTTHLLAVEGNAFAAYVAKINQPSHVDRRCPQCGQCPTLMDNHRACSQIRNAAALPPLLAFELPDAAERAGIQADRAMFAQAQVDDMPPKIDGSEEHTLGVELANTNPDLGPTYAQARYRLLALGLHNGFHYVAEVRADPASSTSNAWLRIDGIGGGIAQPCGIPYYGFADSTGPYYPAVAIYQKV